MALNSINTNIAAYYAQQNIGKASTMASSSISRLSSGNRIVRAADDVAAMSSGTSLRTSVTTLRQALVNTAQGSSLLQVADGALSQVTDILQRQKAIAAQAGSGSLSNQERVFLNQEFQALTAEIDRLVQNTNFNGVTLLDGSIMVETGFFSSEAPAAASGWTLGGLDTDTYTNLAISGQASGNELVIGDIENIDVAEVGTAAGNGDNLRIRFSVNGVVFEGIGDFATMAGAGANDVTVAFSEVTNDGSTGMSFNIVFEDSADVTNVATGTAEIEAQLDGVYFQQARTVTDFATANLAGTGLAGLSNSPVFATWSQDTSSNVVGEVESVSVTPVGDADDSNGQITVTIGGKEYHLYDLGAKGNTLTSADTSLILTYTDGETTRTETITVDLTGMTGSIDLNTEDGAAELKSALEVLLKGSDSVGEGLSFQVGVTTADSLAVSIGAVDTATLFEDATLDVLTQTSAATASDALDIALDSVTAVRANVGALQSRFDFAAANVESAIQNQDAARGVLLDTDIAAEATKFATAQVQLQAGIAVLAQANQLPQNLLKLIG